MSYDWMWNFEISKLQNERYVLLLVNTRILLVILLVRTCITSEDQAGAVAVGSITS